MAFAAAAAGVAERQRERRRMVEARRAPRDRQVALFAVARERRQRVVRVRRALVVRLVALFAPHRRAGEVADLRAGMAAEARRRRVRADQREARAVVHEDRFARIPRALFVAVLAVGAKARQVRIGVAAGTSARGELLHRPAVVVAQEAARLLVCTVQHDAGACAVVEREVGADRLPVAAGVAQRTVGGERVVRHHRAGPLVPAVLRHEVGAGHDQQPQHEAEQRGQTTETRCLLHQNRHCR
jgi:hypothetical protein